MASRKERQALATPLVQLHLMYGMQFRVWFYLDQAGIQTVGELVRFSERGLQKLPEIRERRAAHVVAVLKAFSMAKGVNIELREPRVASREEVLAMSVEELSREGLGQRYINGLKRINIRTIGQLVNSSVDDIRKSNAIGDTGEDDIKTALTYFGRRHQTPLSLKGE